MMNEIFKRNRKTRIVFLLMPIFFSFFLILQLIVVNNIIKKDGFDSDFLFSKIMILIYFITWLLVSLIPFLIYKLILQKQKIVFSDKGIILYNRKIIEEICYDNIKGVHIYYKCKKLGIIIIEGSENSILIGDFENKLKIIKILEEKIGRDKMNEIRE